MCKKVTSLEADGIAFMLASFCGLVNRLTQGSFAACSKMSVSRDIRTRDMFAFPWPCVRDFDEMACSFYSYPCSQDNMDWGRKYGRGALHLLHVTAQNKPRSTTASDQFCRTCSCKA